MNRQEYNAESLEGVKKIGEGAVQMISSLEKLIKSNYSKLDKDGAVKLAEAIKSAKLDKRVIDFQKQIKDLQKSFK